MSQSQVSIIPVNAIDAPFLARLGLCLEERFLLPFVVERPIDVPQTAVNSSRKQVFLNTVVTKLLGAYPSVDGYLLGITHFDLYKTSHQFIFGDAKEGEKTAVVSLHRLRPDFYGESPDENMLFQRTLKECVHELGHALGLKHCFNSRCAMYFSNSIYDTDNKLSYYCESCDKRSRANR